MIILSPLERARALKQARKLYARRKTQQWQKENKDLKQAYDKHRYKVKNNLPLE